MDLNQIPLFSMLKGRLGYLQQRQHVIAQNVAHANTPGYSAQDLKPFAFRSKVEAAALNPSVPTQTNAAHLSGTSGPAGSAVWKTVKAPDSETTLDGNQVVLEEQMIKMTEARMSYDAAIGFYQKSLNLLRLASRAPGRG
jgi:flagellar basal-body rod protein FlgB